MSHQTLEELKRQNAEADASETEATESSPEVEVEERQAEAVETEEAEPELIEESAEEEAEPEEAEAWLVDDEQASSEDQPKSFSGSDIKAARMKERVKAEKRYEREIDELKAQLEAMKQPQSQSPKTPPRLADYDYDEEKFQQAMVEWTDSRIQTQLSTVNNSQNQQRQAEAKMNAVNAHYERAAELVQKHGIKPELYKQTDAEFRDAIESIHPNKGDLVADELIANLGEGSEKVVFHITKNKAKLAEFKNKLAEDPSGLKAAMYLGQQLVSATRPVNIKSKAPKPAASHKGDQGTADQSRGLRDKYLKAHKEGDQQAAFEARRAARQAGVDISKW